MTRRKLNNEKTRNPLQAAISKFLRDNVTDRPLAEIDDLINTAPRRFTIYGALLLLPANTFTNGGTWRCFHEGLSDNGKSRLYQEISLAFSRGPSPVTHIAINAPILPDSTLLSEDNIMRSPTGLLPLHGDFGPAELIGPSSRSPTTADFESAFWTRTEQNGLVQVWAPRWTMFSRGNIKEKARVLGEDAQMTFEGLDGEKGIVGAKLENIAGADFYVGIGYFAFSYLKRGVGKVWGWDINPWSIEGLRKGCDANGWKCEVLRVDDSGNVLDDKGCAGTDALRRLVSGLTASHGGEIRCVAFCGSNVWASEILSKILELYCEEHTESLWKPIRHVNLGLLPHARDSWAQSLQILDGSASSWLHIHENVQVADIESKPHEILSVLEGLDGGGGNELPLQPARKMDCVHTEQVKTYAPDVMHCVFDIRIWANENLNHDPIAAF